MTVMKWRKSGQRYKRLARLSRFVLFEAAAIELYKKLTLSTASIFVSEGLFIYIYFLLSEENHQNRIFRVGEIIPPTISLFFLK